LKARDRHDLAGIAFGLTVKPVSGSSGWWNNLTSSLSADVTAEWPAGPSPSWRCLSGRAWRRQHIAQALHDLLLQDRLEERAMLTALPAVEPAQAAYRKWGWRKVAQKRSPLPGSPLFDVLVTAHHSQRGLIAPKRSSGLWI
jgi:hypothetical protein